MTARFGMAQGGYGLRSTLRRLCAALFLLPFLAFSLIHAGTMPAPDGAGRMTVILCGSTIPVEMAVAADGSLSPVPDHPVGEKKPECGWSIHVQPLMSPLGVSLAGFIPVALDSEPVQRIAVMLPPAPVLLFEARGPPVLI